MALDLSYPAILRQFGRHYVKSATESRAFLAWFLENYYRLEDVEIHDAVCDGMGDKGIDGIYVNRQLRQIDLFQVTVVKAGDKTLGDKKLKQFAGAVSQFSNKANAEVILASANLELKAIAERVELRWTPLLRPRGALFKLVFGEVCSGYFFVVFSRLKSFGKRERPGQRPDRPLLPFVGNSFLPPTAVCFQAPDL